MKHSDVTISILTYTALDACKRTLAAILPTLEGAHLFLTSNGNDKVAEYFHAIKNTYPNVTVVTNFVNAGFMAPNEMAYGSTAEPFFVMLNDDCIPPPDWLDKLKAVMLTNVAVAGAKGTCQHLDENFIGRKSGPVDYIEASCMMVRRELAGSQLFSDYLSFAYSEDADLCLRMREKGHEIAQADFVCEHRRNTTSRHIPGIRHIMENNFATCRKRWSYYLQHRKFSSEA